MTKEGSFRMDQDLFALAGSVLSEAGFAQKEVKLHEAAILLAENAYCIIALAAMPTMNELVAAEPHVEAVFRHAVDNADLGPKLWDAYIVLLTPESSLDQVRGLGPLFNINYDTHGFRRMARVGIEPTLQGVRRALTPFVAPLRLENTGLSTDPLVALSAALIGHGVDESVVNRAVEIYQRGGNLDDAL